jgi:hypothetical protein
LSLRRKKEREMKRFFSAMTVVAVLSMPLAFAGAAPLSSELKGVKAATARFRSVVEAERAGYVRMSPCIPGEGIHFDNAALMEDEDIDPEQPEILLYELKRNGRLRLVGVEYFKVDADQDLSTASDRPSIFGRPFDGPMPGHFPGQPVHYDIHVYIWDPSPSGVFVFPNPRVTCP